MVQKESNLKKQKQTNYVNEKQATINKKKCIFSKHNFFLIFIKCVNKIPIEEQNAINKQNFENENVIKFSHLKNHKTICKYWRVCVSALNY